MLVGGNLCTFAPNVSSRADATKGEDLIPFVEEIGENMRNIDGDQQTVNTVTITATPTPATTRMWLAGKIE